MEADSIRIVRDDAKSEDSELMRSKAHNFLHIARITNIKKTTPKGSHQWEEDGTFSTSFNTEARLHFHILMRTVDSKYVSMNKNVYAELMKNNGNPLLILSDIRSSVPCKFGFFQSVRIPYRKTLGQNSVVLFEESKFSDSPEQLSKILDVLYCLKGD